jgi:hypothetical protein
LKLSQRMFVNSSIFRDTWVIPRRLKKTNRYFRGTLHLEILSPVGSIIFTFSYGSDRLWGPHPVIERVLKTRSLGLKRQGREAD